MKRFYQTIVEHHLNDLNQMVFLAGPRQVGKTTLALNLQSLTDQFIYLNWDDDDDKALILGGGKTINQEKNLIQHAGKKAIIIFDEIHKYKKWKNFVKAYYDKYKDLTRIVVTGSARLDIFNHGGDSMMGRYFPYRIHPLSIAECIQKDFSYDSIKEIQPPLKLGTDSIEALWTFGGFPEPFFKKDKRFSLRWKKLRYQQLFGQDIRNLSHIHEIERIEFLAKILQKHAGKLLNRSDLSRIIRVSIPTIDKWLSILEKFYFCFFIRPWSKNVIRSLVKEPKIYLWDWSEIEDIGMRTENFVASHLLKAVHFWTDLGLGEYDLFFIRDKEKREVDFLVTKNNEPWFLIEVKHSNNHSISEHLYRFQSQLNAPHAFQAIYNLDYVDADCFSYHDPVTVPLATLLSQLV